MVTMAAKWKGKCKNCGVVIPPGTAMDWTKEGGARHVTVDACAEALANPPAPDPPLRGPQPQRPEDFEKLKRLLLAHTWKVASTMPKIPHAYTLRKNWKVDEEFVWCIEHIRAVGYQARFGARVYTYADVDEHQYWDCGGGLMEIEARTGYFLLCGINRALLKPKKAGLFGEL